MATGTRYNAPGNNPSTGGYDGAERTGSIAGYRNENVAPGGVGTQTFRNIGTPTEYAHLKMTLLETTYPSTLLHNFFNKHQLPKKKGDTLTLQRRMELEPVDSPVPEGVYPAPQRIDYEEIRVKPRRYIGWAEITLDAEEMSVQPVWKHTMEALGDQWAESMENICWKALINGRHVRYAGTATARNAIAKEFTVTDVQSVTRDLFRREARVIHSTMKGGNSLMDTPQLESFAAVSHVDLEASLINMQQSALNKVVGDFTPKVSYGGGMKDAVSTYETGQLMRVRFFLHNRLYPIPDAGANAVTSSDANNDVLLTTSGTKNDVYPIPILGMNAMACVGLEGYRGGNSTTSPNPSLRKRRRSGKPSGQLIVNRISDTDSGDPLGLYGSAGWMDMFSPFWENDNWGHCIETGVKAL